MESVAICLYSKYSQRSKEFLDDIHPQMGIQMLCIDNDKVRQAIMNDNQGYHVKTVPCIFLFHSNGRLEKYEGSDAFTWLRKVREALNANMFQQQQQQQQQQPQQTLIQPPQQQQITPIQSLQSIQQQQPQMMPPPSPQQQQKQQVPPPPQPQPLLQDPYGQPPLQPPLNIDNNEPLDITPIGENGIQSLHDNNMPPQQDAEDIINKEMELRMASEQIMTRKQDNIKEIAQAMQRQRESDDDQMEKPALYPKDRL